MAKTTMTNKYDFGKDVQEFFSKSEKKYKANNGNEYVFKINNKIKNTDKQALFENYMAVVKECKKKKEHIDEGVLFLNLIVKYFTNVLLYEDGKEIYTSQSRGIYNKTLKELQIMEELINLELYDQIVGDINPEEIKELKAWFENVGKNLLEISKYIVEDENKINEVISDEE